MDAQGEIFRMTVAHQPMALFKVGVIGRGRGQGLLRGHGHSFGILVRAVLVRALILLRLG